MLLTKLKEKFNVIVLFYISRNIIVVVNIVVWLIWFYTQTSNAPLLWEKHNVFQKLKVVTPTGQIINNGYFFFSDCR